MNLRCQGIGSQLLQMRADCGRIWRCLTRALLNRWLAIVKCLDPDGFGFMRRTSLKPVQERFPGK